MMGVWQSDGALGLGGRVSCRVRQNVACVGVTGMERGRVRFRTASEIMFFSIEGGE